MSGWQCSQTKSCPSRSGQISSLPKASRIPVGVGRPSRNLESIEAIVLDLSAIEVPRDDENRKHVRGRFRLRVEEDLTGPAARDDIAPRIAGCDLDTLERVWELLALHEAERRDRTAAFEAIGLDGFL